MGLSRMSLLTKLLLSTSIAVALLFAITGWIVQDQFVRIASLTLEEEVRGSFHAYESLWGARAARLASVSLILSRMSDVRAAFGTGDQATIQDTAGEVWSKIAEEGALFLVTDPRGRVLASLGGTPISGAPVSDMVRRSVDSFPNQASGFLLQDGHLYQVVVTPVYVAATQGSALLNILVVGFTVNAELARSLKQATGGSDFIFLAEGRTIASTLAASATEMASPAQLEADEPVHVQIAGSEYLQVASTLADMDGRPIGELRILRSFEAARSRIDTLRRNMIALSLVAILAGLLLTYLLARRILMPIRALDEAALEIGRGNYNARVAVKGQDELGRLAQTFNGMCESIRTARDELIRQERITTISRLSTSIVHDLRNPLAAIYGGAEMLVDGDLPPHHIQRLAANIYRSARRVQELLSDLADVTRGKTQAAEICRLGEVVAAARDLLATEADSHRVEIRIDVPHDLELSLERSRMERVFENLLANAIEAMPDGGAVRVSAETRSESVFVSVEDTGPGLPDDVAHHLFQPFVTSQKSHGMGLGLALSRQTVLDHGGDISFEPGPAGRGARFIVRLPIMKPVDFTAALQSHND